MKEGKGRGRKTTRAQATKGLLLSQILKRIMIVTYSHNQPQVYNTSLFLNTILSYHQLHQGVLKR
jgi:hypothetical protein